MAAGASSRRSIQLSRSAMSASCSRSIHQSGSDGPTCARTVPATVELEAATAHSARVVAAEEATTRSTKIASLPCCQR
jgi:hypothetical protein